MGIRQKEPEKKDTDTATGQIRDNVNIQIYKERIISHWIK